MAASSLADFGLLLSQLRDKALHLGLERLAVVLLRFRADVATGGQYIAVLAYVCQGGAFAEAGDVGVGVDTLTLDTLTPALSLRGRGGRREPLPQGERG